ncbi:hypothetical protein G7048_19230 [Diaphorobacter sp. HDW4B]|uniref:hypothetical protein n=1 Tax=Diaphorobacter sp. HDW4B TaxID=2714925 RepID=UPI00140BD560|nr:hypothetical protein [Diaphorobacter sp. HDW4B]QIL72299.1 hypothetical protein G7048_19230 [Diaphorobacter sp. HDW4B]
MLIPIVDHRGVFFAVNEPHVAQCFDECAILACPVNAQLNVLIRQPRQIAVAAVFSSPQEQANEIPSGSSAQAFDELLGLWVTRQPGIDSSVCHHDYCPIALQMAS